MDAAQAHQAIAALLGNTAFRAPPPLPIGCCGKGCAGCVWEGYFAAVRFWLEDAAQIRQLIQTP